MLKNLFEKTVFLFGAGFSKYPGCFLSTDMLQSLQTNIKDISIDDNENYKNKECYSEIFNFILASLRYQNTIKYIGSDETDYVNIEDFVMVLRQLIDKEFIIPYPLIGNWNDKITKWEIVDEEIFEKFKKFIISLLLSVWTDFSISKAQNQLGPIREILNSHENFKINFYSLNYDLILERVFNSNTTRLLDNGFSERKIDNNRVLIWSKDYNNPNSTTKINLFKLHGSLDWEYDRGSEEIIINHDYILSRDPLLIFGSYSKMLSFDPFLYMLSKFRDSLEEATIFVVIGYSFHDKYINNLLIQQLNQNTVNDAPKRMLIIDPSNKNITNSMFVERLKGIQDNKSIADIINFKQISPERIRLIPMDASQFIKSYFDNDAKLLQGELISTEKSTSIF